MVKDSSIVYEHSQEQIAKFVANHFGGNLQKIEIRKFSNGELYTEEQQLNSNNVLVIFPNIRNIHEQMFEFITMIGICQNSKNISALIPYIPYSRQDKSVNFQNILNIFESLNINKIYTFDIHNDANLPNNIVNILPHRIFGLHLKNVKDAVIIAPDKGALKRAATFARYLDCELIAIDKKSGICRNIEAAQDKHCIIVDDIIDTGRTIENAYNLIEQISPNCISACITHVFNKAYIECKAGIEFYTIDKLIIENNLNKL